MKQVILFIFLLALLSSCGGKSKSSSVIEAEKAIPLRYAENLSLSATEDYTIAVCAIHGIRPGYCTPMSWLTKKSPCLPICRKGHLSARH